MDLTADASQARRSPLALPLIAATVVAVAAIGGLATDTTSSWYQQLDRPSFQPGGAVFGPVWTVLYVMLGVSAWLAWRDVRDEDRGRVIALYGANFVLNAAWTLIFFQGHAPVAAGIEILVLLGTIIALIVLVRRWSPVAAWLLVPYAAWVAFASVLTWTIALTN